MQLLSGIGHLRVVWHLIMPTIDIWSLTLYKCDHISAGVTPSIVGGTCCRAGVSASVGGGGRAQLPFERRGSVGGLAEDMRGAESGLLALQGGLDAEEGSDSDAGELGDSSSVSGEQTAALVASCDNSSVSGEQTAELVASCDSSSVSSEQTAELVASCDKAPACGC
jgi:hypothetical protein